MNSISSQSLILLPWDKGYEEIYIGGSLGNKDARGYYFKRLANGGDF